jgi:adenylate cyclase
LLYPKALGGRLRYSTLNQGRPSTATADLGTQLIEALPRALDVMQIQALGILCLRLEAAVAATQPGSAYAAACEPSPTVPSNSPSMSRRKRSIHPYIAAYPVRVDATDEELYAILEGIIIRIENLTNSLVLERLGPYTEVLAALSQATRIDPNLIVRALSLFAGTMRATA